MFTADKFILPPLKFQQGIVVAYRCFLLLALSIPTTTTAAAAATTVLAQQYTVHMGIAMICLLLLKIFKFYFIFVFYLCCCCCCCCFCFCCCYCLFVSYLENKFLIINFHLFHLFVCSFEMKFYLAKGLMCMCVCMCRFLRLTVVTQ